MEYAPWSDQTPIETNSPQFTCNTVFKEILTNGYQWRFRWGEKPYWIYIGGYDKCFGFNLNVPWWLSLISKSPCRVPKCRSWIWSTTARAVDIAELALRALTMLAPRCCISFWKRSFKLLPAAFLKGGSVGLFSNATGQDLVPKHTHESWTILLKPKGWASWVKSSERKNTVLTS